MPPPQKFFFNFWSQNAYFGAFSGPPRVFLQRSTSRSIRALRLPTLISRLTVARSKHSKALECLQKRVLNIIFPSSEYDKFRPRPNHCQRRNTESRRRLLLQLFFRRSSVFFGGAWPLAPLWILKAKNRCSKPLNDT